MRNIHTCIRQFYIERQTYNDINSESANTFDVLGQFLTKCRGFGGTLSYHVE